jgi:glutamyl-tRNA synthetase
MGGVRTALYNYLFAKKHGGQFILRIEDTDQTRYVPGAEAYILEALKWCNILPDEGFERGGNYGPYKQSERKHLYRQYADQLLDAGHAYYAFDTAEDLDRMRAMAKAAGTANWQYNHVTRSSMKNSLTLSKAEVEAKLAAGEPYVIRIKLERNEEVKFEDMVRGWVSVNTNNMDDKVLFKSDGMPTYHLANIVDDHLMEISHVIRGEEWLPSAPLHILLYRYFGWEESRPQFAHLPLLLKPDGNGKLSKRDGDRLGFPVFPLQWVNPETNETSSGYREQGYFPGAFINMLAFLGWNPGTEQEVFSMQELIDAFSIERVNKAGAKYDHDKTKWYNQQYLRSKTDEVLAEMLLPELEAKNPNVDKAFVQKVVALVKERAYFAKDILSEGAYLFERPTSYDEKTVSKKWKPDARVHVQSLRQRFETLSYFESEDVEKVFKTYLEEQGVGFGKVGPGFRLAVTGVGMGPSMFDICAILGKKETLERMDAALETLPNG